MRDELPTRIGGIAANMARVGSIAEWPDARTVAFDLFEESKHFIEWTANEAEADTTRALIDLQLQLALWQLQLDTLWGDEKSRTEIGARAREYSNDLIQRSGLINGR